MQIQACGLKYSQIHVYFMNVKTICQDICTTGFSRRPVVEVFWMECYVHVLQMVFYLFIKYRANDEWGDYVVHSCK